MDVDLLDALLASPELLILDVGGEGRHAQAWNLNPCRRVTVGPRRGNPIPRLIVGRADAIPLRSGSVDLVVAERVPLLSPALREIRRVVRPAGLVVLRHARTPAGDPHRHALRLLVGVVTQRSIWQDGRPLAETSIRLA